MNRYEFTSRTQKSIREIRSQILEARMKGITHMELGIEFLAQRASRDLARDAIASLNYSVNQCRKELAFRKSKGIS